MATRVSFNQWLTLQKTGPHAALAEKWVTTRGRLTRDAVEARAAAAGLPAGAGAAAYDSYCADVAAKATTTPPPPGYPDDSAMLALDPSKI